MQKVKSILSNTYNHTLSDPELDEAAHNLFGFLRVLIEIDQEQRYCAKNIETIGNNDESDHTCTSFH